MHRRLSRALFNGVTVIALASVGPALAGDHGGGGGKKHQDTTFRVRLTNTWGSSPLTFGRVTIGLSRSPERRLPGPTPR